MKGLEGRIAVVTAAGSGIGRATALRLAREGAAVACVDLKPEAAEATGRAVAAGGGKALAIPCDAQEGSQVTGMVERVLETWGRIDILVNGVGGGQRAASILDISEEAWERMLRFNLTTAFLCCRAILPAMLRQGYGRIINIASIAGLHASVNGAHYAGYAASKAGLMGLTRELAGSWGRKGIRVNAIAPGFFHSRLADPAIVHAEPQIKATSPIPRVGDAGELKGVAVFLASDASNYITGQTIVVDGGRTIAS